MKAPENRGFLQLSNLKSARRGDFPEIEVTRSRCGYATCLDT
jgi:hypothetical protein